MKTTTIYRETLTITTDDDGTRTITRSHSARTNSALLFEELSPEAQQRAIRDAIEEETHNYYSSAWDYASHTGTDVSEIWDAYRDLAKHQPVECHDHYSSFFLAVGSAERVTPEEDTGICWSMDICDAWNEYAAAVQMLIEEAEEHEGRADEITAPYYWPYCVADHEPASVLAYSVAHGNHADRCREKADELAEQAKDAVESTMHDLIEEVEEYYSSAEFWREWFTEEDQIFTRDGERI